MMNATALSKTKEDILSYISLKGPSLPATISSELRVPLLFISAFLSELYHEEKLLMSHLKVGTSSLYLIPGQEKQLENFIQHLNSREKEAFHIARQKKIVKDSELQPVHRVAIREIKDFVRPINVNGEQAWEYIYTNADTKEEPETVPVLKPAMQEISQLQPVTEQVKKIEESIQQIETELASPLSQKQEKKRRSPKKQAMQEEKTFSLSLQSSQPITPFSEEVRQFLEKSSYTVHSLIKAEKKEASFKATIPGPHGIQSYLVLAKDKKKLKEEELQEALSQAHSQRLLCLVLARGELDKKTSSFVNGWGNFLAYREF